MNSELPNWGTNLCNIVGCLARQEETHSYETRSEFEILVVLLLVRAFVSSGRLFVPKTGHVTAGRFTRNSPHMQPTSTIKDFSFTNVILFLFWRWESPTASPLPWLFNSWKNCSTSARASFSATTAISIHSYDTPTSWTPQRKLAADPPSGKRNSHVPPLSSPPEPESELVLITRRLLCEFSLACKSCMRAFSIRCTFSNGFGTIFSRRLFRAVIFLFDNTWSPSNKNTSNKQAWPTFNALNLAS